MNFMSEKAVLEIENVGVSYVGVQAIKGVNLSVNAGEFFGLIGVNGAGKTTLVTQLSGLYPPTDGNAWIGGFDIKS